MLGVLVLIIILYIYFKNRNAPKIFYTTPTNGKVKQVLTASDIQSRNTVLNKNNLTYHLFLYIKDWNYLYGFTKEILEKGEAQKACPGLYLDPKINSIIIIVMY